MTEKIEAKLSEAREQLAAWQAQQAAAAQQVERWAAVVQCCEELLEEEAVSR